ncbi:MAG: CpXC domain-containing protein [Oscillospiraceae bacterium]|nr:CpXC domain-containing protein [Oscillospiraceae bacterium]
MSRSKKMPITCPKCGKTNDFRIWDSINTMLDPEMKGKVKDRSAFLFTCPDCGAKNYIDYGFLYHQMEDRLMIAYANSDANEEEMYKIFTEKHDEIPEMYEVFRESGYIMRIARSLDALREKIYIFDDHLDDRIIEIYKLFIYVRVHDDNPDKDDINIFYMGGEKPHFEVITSTESLGFTDFNKGLYESIVKEYSGLMPDIRQDDPVIDRYHAMELLERKRDKEQG